MAGLQISVPPQVEPILLRDAKVYLKVDYPDEDDLISGLIVAAREMVENFTARSLVNKTYVQTLDSFPYFTDTVMSQMAYPPSYYSLPRYSTTLWNYSQMIKLLVSPLVKVVNIAYVASKDQQWHSLLQAPPPWYPNIAIATGNIFMDGNGNNIEALNDGTTGFNPPKWATGLGETTTEDGGVEWQNNGPAPLDQMGVIGDAANTFYTDIVSEPPRIFPGPAGAFWPSVQYVPNAVQIYYVAGHGEPTGQGDQLSPPSGMPQVCVTAMYQLIAGWYENRDALSPLNLKNMPLHVEALLWSKRVMDYQPTRG